MQQEELFQWIRANGGYVAGMRRRGAQLRTGQVYTKAMLMATNAGYPSKMTALFPLQVHAAASMADCPGIHWLPGGDGIELVQKFDTKTNSAQ